MIAFLGVSPKVLVTFTADIGKILSALHNVAIGGQVSFGTSVQIAQVRTDILFWYLWRELMTQLLLS